MIRGTFRLAAGAALAGALWPAAATADTPSAAWQCRASVVREVSPLQRFEPLVANGDPSTGGDRPACAPDFEGIPVFDGTASFAPARVRLAEPNATTAATPATAEPRDQSVSATAYADEAVVDLGGGSLEVTATDLRAEATGRCVGGAPAVAGTSHVDTLSVNGQVLSLQDNGFFEVTRQVGASPLGDVVRIVANDTVRTATGVTVQALRIELLSAAGAPLASVVLGEAKASASDLTCAPPATPPEEPPADPPANPPGNQPPGDQPAGTSTTTTVTTAAPAPTPAPVRGSGSPVTPTKVVVNGSGGGCGRVSMWFSKVAKRGTLKGRPRSATSRYGTRVVLRGVLRSCGGKPIVGARLDVVHRFGSKVRTKTGLKSRAGGALTLILPMNLATRTITIAYRGDLARKKVTSSRVLRLTVEDGKGHVLHAAPKAKGKRLA